MNRPYYLLFEAWYLIYRSLFSEPLVYGDVNTQAAVVIWYWWTNTGINTCTHVCMHVRARTHTHTFTSHTPTHPHTHARTNTHDTYTTGFRKISSTKSTHKYFGRAKVVIESTCPSCNAARLNSESYCWRASFLPLIHDFTYIGEKIMKRANKKKQE